MNDTFRTAGLRLTPLAACVALAFAVGTTASTETVAREKGNRAEPKPLFERLRRTGDGFEQIQRARLEAGWEKARTVAPRPAGTTPVTSCADDGSAGTLRDVIANAVDGDVVDLSALTCSSITLTTGGLAVNVDNLSVIGPGAAALTIDAAGGGTAFDFFGAEYGGYGTLSVTGLTLTNGYYLDAAGGAIWTANGGSVVLTDSAVTNSTSNGKYASGGGIFADGNVTIVNSTISGNLADSSKYDGIGGGVYANGNVSITSSTISGNTARSNGSYTYGGYTYYGAGFGGGVSAGGVLTISNSTISGNAASYGGGVAAGAIGSLTNSTITLNTANASNSSGTYGAEGGGVVILIGKGGKDSAPQGVGAANIGSSILFGNSGGGTLFGADLGGTTGAAVTGANALVGSSTLTLPPGTLSGNPLLAPLANNGGPTQTHALGTGSPAIDAGNNAAALETDQRGEGFPRVSGTAADIGAYETQAGGGGPEPEAVALPTMSTWALALMAGLLGLFGWRRQREERAPR
ncbi:IPTL-CTERM sorting domain-containing protein [Dokdonella sp. MW10]|uniref:IPTL-CTERM sorting domain-containing protein n=1 Tax=Dokdonella sp. MW10 TaxID=2992926 RepID=UPI003F81F86A